MKNEHKYAQVLRWIADGEDVQVRHPSTELDWCPLLDHHDLFMAELIRGESVNNWEFRIKPRTVMCNGVEVPAPESVAPTRHMRYLVPSVVQTEGYTVLEWKDMDHDKRLLAEGLVYLDMAACIARTNAMRLTQPC